MRLNVHSVTRRFKDSFQNATFVLTAFRNKCYSNIDYEVAADLQTSFVLLKT